MDLPETACVVLCLIYFVRAQDQRQDLGDVSFQWANDTMAIPRCPHTLLIKYLDDRVIFKACMNDFEQDKIDYCNYLGNVEDRPHYVPIAATGVCSDQNITSLFFVTLIADDDPQIRGGMFCQDKPDNKASINLPMTNRNGIGFSDLEMEIPNADKTVSDKVKRDSVDIPENGFLMNIQVVVDETFKGRFKATEIGPGSPVDRRIASVFCHTQAFWYASNSLGTSVRLHFRAYPIIENFEAMQANVSTLIKISEDFDKYAPGADPDARAYVFMCSQENKPGTIGIAWVKASCADPKFRTSINEYVNNDGYTGEIVAHELGHNLGMRHDFTGASRQPKYCDLEQSINCTGVDGIMDYQDRNRSRWSCCSKQDFWNFHDSETGNCLDPDTVVFPPTMPALSFDGDPEMASTSSTTTTTTATTKEICWNRRRLCGSKKRKAMRRLGMSNNCDFDCANLSWTSSERRVCRNTRGFLRRNCPRACCTCQASYNQSRHCLLI